MERTRSHESGHRVTILEEDLVGMPQSLKNRVRAGRRLQTPFERGALEIAPSSGYVTLAACHPDGQELGPPIRTVFRSDRFYSGMHDVEIRGFHGGTVRYTRNVATQYHVRVGCENMAHSRGQFEVMRVLQRWSLAALPDGAQITSARLVLEQEDHTSPRHYWPMQRPVNLFLDEVKKSWNPGRGGQERDNLSEPEAGDVWWLESKAKTVPWHQPGCGFASDDHPDADRSEQPLAAASVRGHKEPVQFFGPRFTAYVQKAMERDKTLNLLVRAGNDHELIPGAVCCFYSAEFGEDTNPRQRPRLEIEWRAPVLWAERTPYVLEPGTSCVITPSHVLPDDKDIILCSTVEPVEAPDSGAPRDPSESPAGRSLPTEVYVEDWVSADSATGPTRRTLALPVAGHAGSECKIRASTQAHPVTAGTDFVTRILQTWVPSEKDARDISVRFRFTAPSGQVQDRRARYVGDHLYECTFRPDEVGIWHYAWRARPDRRLQAQRARGYFTVIQGSGELKMSALNEFARAALESTQEIRDTLERRRGNFRLTAIHRELYLCHLEALAQGAPSVNLNQLEALLDEITERLTKVH